MEQTLSDRGDGRARLLAAAVPHVVFDGWTAISLRAAAVDAGMDAGLVRVLCPRGALDLAIDYHRAGDRAMQEALAHADLSALRFRERIAHAVRLRLAGADREVVRRGMTLFALPHHMAEGSALVWGTADAIWRALGDTATDLNWYTKRLSLSAVYSATVLFWLGDKSPDSADSWAFLERRIEDVMRFEKAKADFRASGVGRILAGPLKILDHFQAPAPRSAEVPADGPVDAPIKKGQ